MTEDRVAQIESRLAAATPGPWDLDIFDDEHGWHVWLNVEADRLIGAVHDGESFQPMSREDADLIANAPEDLAYLIAEVRRLRTELASDGNQSSYLPPRDFWRPLGSATYPQATPRAISPDPGSTSGWSR